MSPAQAQAKLDAERAVAFRDLENVRRFYDRPEAIETQNAIMAQLRGDSQPFGQDVQQAMFADAADAGAGQYAAAQDAYQQQAANAGVKVGGAMYNVARDVGAQTRKARRDIRSRAALENFQAKERAQGAAANYLRDKSAAQWAPVLRSTEMRERFQVTGQSPEAANPAALGMGGASGIPQGGMNAVSYNPYAPGSSGGGRTMANGQPKGGSSYGGVTKIDGMNAAPWMSGGS
ncbi:MAG: hypothetical protein ACE5D3_05495, partial [Candidatus Binatia bacterium]